MKTIITSILFLLTLNLFADDLTDLQNQYNRAIAKVSEPINKVYVKELQALLEKVSKEGNLDKVAAVTTELKKFSEGESRGILLVTEKGKIERFFVDKKWRTPFGTTFWFQKNGQGMKTTGTDTSPFTWRIIENGIVEYNGRVVSSEPIKTEYIKFLSKKEAYIGKSSDKIDIPLSPGN